MNHVIASSAIFLLAGAVGATEQSHGVQLSRNEPAARRDVCEQKSRNWSTMRSTLVAVSKFRGANNANVQKDRPQCHRWIGEFFDWQIRAPICARQVWRTDAQ
ncbi:hypothetical protein [Variovorax sp. 54]|uniref:hypothetical protein n=1 Tax=Variovorax sp. 54 TaxID=2035212 RepID=UPI00117E7646|nr:hypothetical protein [Variovorax sp. 54]